MDLVDEPVESYLKPSGTEAAAWTKLKLEDVGSETFLSRFELVMPIDPYDCDFAIDAILGLKSGSGKDEEVLIKGEGTEANRPLAVDVFISADRMAGELYSQDDGPGSAPVLRGRTCKLAARMWPRLGRLSPAVWLCIQVSLATEASPPIDTIDTDLLCLCPPKLTSLGAPLASLVPKASFEPVEELSDKADLCKPILGRAPFPVDTEVVWKWVNGVGTDGDGNDSFHRSRPDVGLRNSGLGDGF